MCYWCFKAEVEEFGAIPITDTILAAGRVATAAMAFPSLHIVIEDWNLDDDNLETARKHVNADFANGVAIPLKVRSFLMMFQEIGYLERFYALALAEGYIDDLGQPTALARAHEGEPS